MIIGSFDKFCLFILLFFIWPSNSSTLYSNSILSIGLLFIKKNPTHLTLYQLHIYSVTASWKKTNTSFIFSILFTCFLLKKTLGFFFLYSIYSFSKKKKKKKTFLRVLCQANHDLS